jgi:adenylate cyclase, class 2
MAPQPSAVNTEIAVAIEIELKFRLECPDPLRERLRRLGTPAGPSVLETNRIFDTPDRRLRKADCGLRVREVQPWPAGPVVEFGVRPAVFTYKGPRQAGQFKVREELETPVQDAAALIAILAQLGFSEVVVFEKRRAAWQVGPCVVTLDELPRLGWWAEIEGPTESAVTDVQAHLGLAEASPVPETYVALAATHGSPDSNGCRRLMFDTPE